MKKDEIYYFAYGSNISSSTLKKYCPSAMRVCVAKLSDYSLDFQFWASIVPEASKHVWGIVWTVEKEHIEKLDEYEDVENNLYRAINVTVESLGDQTPFMCRSYELTTFPTRIKSLDPEQNVNCHLTESQQPAKWYMDMIIESSRSQGIPAPYITELQSVPVSLTTKWEDFE